MIKKLFVVLFVFAFTLCFLHSATIVNQRIGCVDMNKVIEANPEAKAIKDELLADLQTRKNNIKNSQEQLAKFEKEIATMESEMLEYEKSKQQGTVAVSTGTSADVSNTVNISSQTLPLQPSSTQQPQPSLPQQGQQQQYQQLQQPQPSSPQQPSFRQPSQSSSMSVIRSTVPPSPEGIRTSTGTTKQNITNQKVQVSSPAFSYVDIDDKKLMLTKQKVDLAEYISSTELEEKNINKKIKKNLLGKIYDSIKEVVEEEGLTVVLDSSNVIYDEGVADITDKVISKMKKK